MLVTWTFKYATTCQAEIDALIRQLRDFQHLLEQYEEPRLKNTQSTISFQKSVVQVDTSANETSQKNQVLIISPSEHTNHLITLRKECDRTWDALLPYLKEPVKLVIGEDRLHFPTGLAEPYTTPQTLQSLERIRTTVLRFIQQGYNLIEVEGHTDNVPIKTLQYPSNWELSVARALYLAKQIDTFLESEGYERTKDYTICAAGFGEYLQVVKSYKIQEEKRNRRIEITFFRRKLHVRDSDIR